MPQVADAQRALCWWCWLGCCQCESPCLLRGCQLVARHRPAHAGVAAHTPDCSLQQEQSHQCPTRSTQHAAYEGSLTQLAAGAVASLHAAQLVLRRASASLQASSLPQQQAMWMRAGAYQSYDLLQVGGWAGRPGALCCRRLLLAGSASQPAGVRARSPGRRAGEALAGFGWWLPEVLCEVGSVHHGCDHQRSNST